jgi:hypothetical protein
MSSMPGDGEPRRLTSTDDPVEADMIERMLAGHDIPSMIQRPNGWVSQMIPAASGPHEIFVRPADYDRAVELIEPHFGIR